MTTIVTRSGKGSPLTNNEVDTNFTNLNTDKLETSGGSLTGAVSVVASTAGALVRITQTGAGDALLVEDSANPDSSPFVVDASGNVGIGTTAPANKLTVSAASGAVNATVGNGTATNVLGVTSGNAGLLGMTSNHELGIYTNNTVRMTIQAAGNVGVGTASPAVKFAVSSTDAILVPVGTTGERPTGATGYLRYNTTTGGFEGHNGSNWGSIGGGATGGGTDQMFYLNGQTVTTNYSIPSGQNAGTFGPVTVDSGATVTVPSGSTWTVV